ncbi:MAG: toxic anion resistance protein, partial [Lachnospiraceae bacterium]|nr:toxic anion resistance protein [Lachnospiraceae bacterium]
MSNELDEMIGAAPTLTLNPTATETTDAIAAMTLTPDAKEEEKIPVPEVNLTPQEKKMVDDFAAQIDITNTQQVMQYGSGSQKKIADFSESALGNVRTKDMGEIGKMLTDVVAELRNFENDEEKGLFGGLFKKSTSRLLDMKAKYDKAEVNVNKICKVMEGHQVTLLKDIAMLDKMYDLNMNYYKELTMYILAGKQKLEHAKNVELPELVAKAERTGLPEDTQAARDFSAQIDRFEKKIYDLELTKTISLQMAPKIRLIQTNDTAMSEKIQSTLVNTIPLWKSQMVIAIGLNHSTNAAKAQKEVSDMTNA